MPELTNGADPLDAARIDDAPERTRHTIRQRRSLPNGRAIVGAALVTSAAVGAFLVASVDDAGPDTSYLVLSTDVDAGEPLSTSDVVAERLDLGVGVATTAVGASADVAGSYALRDLRAGELLAIDDLLAGPQPAGRPVGAIHELTVPVPVDRSPAFLLPGDRVTILSTVRRAEGLVTVVAVEDALVLGFEAAAGRIGPSSPTLLTLAIDDPETVVAVAHLAQVGDVTVVRSTRALDDRYPVEEQLVAIESTVEP